MAGKRVINGGTSGQCAVIRRQFRTARHKQWAKQPSNGGGRDAKGRLFVLYSQLLPLHEQLSDEDKDTHQFPEKDFDSFVSNPLTAN